MKSSKPEKTRAEAGDTRHRWRLEECSQEGAHQGQATCASEKANESETAPEMSAVSRELVLPQPLEKDRSATRSISFDGESIGHTITLLGRQRAARHPSVELVDDGIAVIGVDAWTVEQRKEQVNGLGNSLGNINLCMVHCLTPNKWVTGRTRIVGHPRGSTIGFPLRGCVTRYFPREYETPCNATRYSHGTSIGPWPLRRS